MKKLIHKEFVRQFTAKELHVLYGRRMKNLIWLSAVFFVTFLAIGFSNGSLNYLEMKMKSPFVNWVNLAIPANEAHRMDELIQLLNDSAVKQRYKIASANAYHEFTINLWDTGNQGTRVFIGRSVAIDDPLLSEVFSAKNVIRGNSFVSDNEIGLIVTDSLLKATSQDTSLRFVYWRFRDSHQEYRNLPLPVVAVVKELPGKHLFAATPYMYALLWESPAGNPFNPIDERELYLFVGDNNDNALSIRDSVDMYFRRQSRKGFRPYVAPTLLDDYFGFNNGYLIKATFRPQPQSLLSIDSIYSQLQADEHLEWLKPKIERYYNYSSRLYPVHHIRQYDNLSLNFSALSQVRSFASYLSGLEYTLKIDMAQTEAKENYDFVSRLTRIGSLILLLFSIYAISMFLSDVMRMHIEKNRMNLGTLMAFGIDNRVLRNLYARIAFRFVTFAMFAGLVVSALFGGSGGLRLLLRMFGAGMESGQLFFSLLNEWTAVAVIATWLTSFLAVFFTLGRMLKYTPGDLVYERK